MLEREKGEGEEEETYSNEDVKNLYALIRRYDLSPRLVPQPIF